MEFQVIDLEHTERLMIESPATETGCCRTVLAGACCDASASSEMMIVVWANVVAGLTVLVGILCIVFGISSFVVILGWVSLSIGCTLFALQLAGVTIYVICLCILKYL